MTDDKLDTEAQRQAAAWVRALPEETPNLAWRAALNERVRAEADRRAQRRRRWGLVRPALGLALAASLAAVVIVPRSGVGAAPAPTPERGRVEASLVALHDRAVQNADIAGTGLDPEEAPAAPAAHDPLEDLETL